MIKDKNNIDISNLIESIMGEYANSEYLPASLKHALKNILNTEDGRSHLINVLSNPEIYLRSFDNFPSESKSRIRKIIEEENNRRSYWFRHMFLRSYIARLFLKAQRYLPKANLIARIIWGGPQKVQNILVYYFRKWRFSTKYWRFEDLLVTLNLDILGLQGDYVSKIKLDQYTCSLGKVNNVDYAYLCGIDIIHARDANYILECNLSPALRADRKRFYQTDPVAKEIVDATISSGHKNLILLWGWFTPVNPWLLGHFRYLCKLHNISLSIYLDPRLRNTVKPQQNIIFKAFPDRSSLNDALVVKARNDYIAQDYVISNKNMLNRILNSWLTTAGNSSFKVPIMKRQPQLEWLSRADPGLPNLVYKYSSEDKGEGVFFMNASSLEHANSLAGHINENTRLNDGYFQPFICSKLLDDRRFYDVRSFILILPDETQFIGCLRKASNHRLPNQLPPGIVKDISPFMMNPHAGNDYKSCPDEEIQSIRETSIAIGLAIREMFSRAFFIDMHNTVIQK